MFTSIEHVSQLTLEEAHMIANTDWSDMCVTIEDFDAAVVSVVRGPDGSHIFFDDLYELEGELEEDQLDNLGLLSDQGKIEALRLREVFLFVRELDSNMLGAVFDQFILWK